MRDKQLLQLFLVLNVALAACFVVYLLLSSRGGPKVVTTTFQPLPVATNKLVPKPPPPVAKSNDVPVAVVVEVKPAATNEPAVATPAATNEAPFLPAFTTRKFGWQDVESEGYRDYLANLRGIGCPEEKVRYIILSDINDLFAQKRLKEAVDHDPQWWRAEPEITIANVLQEKGRKLDEERRVLIEKLLGKEALALEQEKGEAAFWNNVQLTGPVLGSLPAEVHQSVQEICGRSMERTQNAFWARVNDGQAANQVEMAKLREQTRADLRKILDAAALEEFLLRYSHNAHQLRAQLRGFEASPDEFRKIFRGIDTIEHQLQLEYGGPEALSPQQRERYDRQREAAIKEALGPKRYEEYLVTKDPLYRQAQMTAMQYGAPPNAIMPVYEMFKANEQKRQKILADASLSLQQKTETLNTVNQDQLKSLQRIVTEAAGRR